MVSILRKTKEERGKRKYILILSCLILLPISYKLSNPEFLLLKPTKSEMMFPGQKNNTGVEAKNATVEGGLGSEQGTNVKLISLVFVTASSANHMLALLLDHLPSIEKWVLNTTTPTFLPTLEGESALTKADLSVRVIHYNLDPVEKRALKKNQANIQKLRNKFPYVELREFDYAAYPSYFNIEIASGEYAFKPVIVEQVARELQNMDADNSTFGTTPNKGYGSYAQSYLYWLDAGVKIEDGGRPFQEDFQIAKKQGIYTPSSPGPLKRYTVQGTADYLGLDHEIYVNPETRIGSGGIVLLDLKNQTIYDSVIKPWMTCARVKECIAPKGEKKI